MTFFAALAILQGLAAADVPAISVEIPAGHNYATIAHMLHPGNRLGYRFQEHAPIVHGAVPASVENPDETIASFSRREHAAQFSISIAEKDWVRQRWTFHLAPTGDGVDVLWVIDTEDTGLNVYYAVQQCFRLGGVTNEAWRRKIAETPAFSEYDLWNVKEKNTQTKTSLSYVLRKGAWVPFPAGKKTVGARTPLGIAMDNAITGGQLDAMPEVGSYHAKMLEPIDSGLAARTSTDGAWVCALYWPGATHVTDHHPADCLHAIVNIGGIPPHARRAIRGKIYWFKGSLAGLARHWNRDFPKG